MMTQAIDNSSHAPEMWMNMNASAAGSFYPSRGSFDPRQAVLASYLPTFVFGMAGNGLVIYIIAYYKSVRTKSVANYYIWNLSFADLFFILTLPFFCYTTYYQDWPFGWFVCKLSYAIRETNRFASVFTLVALSMDRYIASFYNLGHLRTIKAGKLVCFAVWFLCLCTSAPYWLFAHLVTGGPQNKTTCKFSWPRAYNAEYSTAWTYLQFLTAYALPSGLILSSYILLARRLNKLLKNRCQNSSRIQKPNKKMTRTVLMVVLTFLLCQTPYHVVQFISLRKVLKAEEYAKAGKAFRPDPDEYKTFVILNAIAQILVFVSSCCNPIIYGLLNDNYRKLYNVVLCRCRRQAVAEDTANGVSSGDSRQHAEARVTYRLQITFSLPCSKRQLARSRQNRAPTSTEQVELDDKSTTNKLLPSTAAAAAAAAAAVTPGPSSAP